MFKIKLKRGALKECKKQNKTKDHGEGEYHRGLFWAAEPYLADTLVVKETHSLTNVNGVVPVISSHCAGVVPPEIIGLF